MAGTRQLKLSLRDEKGRHASKQVALDVSEKHLHGVKCEVYELLLQSADDLHGASDEVKYLCYERGVTKNFTTEIVDDPLERPFALRLLSNIKIDKPGAYTFHVEACSAAVLDINGKRVVDKDFFDHGKVIEENGRKRKTVSARCGTITLDAGVHPIEVIMYRRAMNQPRYLEWSFFWSGPGFEKQPIPDNVLMLELE
jgi:hypothetical protein